MKDIWKYIIPLIIGLAIGLLMNIPSCSKQPEPEIIHIEKHDTVTIEKEKIVEKTKVKYINRIDTFYVTKSGDTIQTPDLPIEHKEYHDTISTDSTSTEIQINYSGFNASIDQVNLIHNYYNQKEIIIKEPKKVGFGWYFGIGAGFGGHANINNGTFGYGPEVSVQVGVGLTGRIK